MEISMSSSSSALAIVNRRKREASFVLNNTGISLLSRHNYKEAIDTFKDAWDMMRSSFHKRRSSHFDCTEEVINNLFEDQEMMKVDNDELEVNDTNTAISATTTNAPPINTTTTSATSRTPISTSQCGTSEFFHLEINETLHRASLLLARSSTTTRIIENIVDTKCYNLIELADDMNAIAVSTTLHQIELEALGAKCFSYISENSHNYVDTTISTDSCIRPKPNSYHVVRIHPSNDNDDYDDVVNTIHEIPVSSLYLNLAIILLNYGGACRMYAIEYMDDIVQSSKMMIYAFHLIGLAQDILCIINLNELDQCNIIKFTLLSTLVLQNFIQICFYYQMNEECFYMYYIQIRKLRLLLENEIIKENICYGTISSLLYDQRSAAAA